MTVCIDRLLRILDFSSSHTLNWITHHRWGSCSRCQRILRCICNRILDCNQRRWLCCDTALLLQRRTLQRPVAVQVHLHRFSIRMNQLDIFSFSNKLECKMWLNRVSNWILNDVHYNKSYRIQFSVEIDTCNIWIDMEPKLYFDETNFSVISEKTEKKRKRKESTQLSPVLISGDWISAKEPVFPTWYIHIPAIPIFDSLWK